MYKILMKILHKDNNLENIQYLYILFLILTVLYKN